MNQDQQISLQLSVDEINTILNALGDRPYAQVFGIIQKIQQQAASQLQAASANGQEAAKEEKKSK